MGANDDRMQRGSPAFAGSSPVTRGAGLPLEKERSLAEQRDELLVQIDELESALRFMGEGHRERHPSEQKLAQLRILLGQVERASS